MEIHKGIEISGLSLFSKKSKTLIFGDVHIGIEESLRKGGIMLPINHFDDITKEVKTLLNTLKPRTIIINGDLKHHFGTISIEEWDKILKFLRMILEYGEVKIVQGNHDKILKPIADKLNILMKKYFIDDDTYICHGDNIPVDSDFKKSKTIIIGHEHPAVKLVDGARTETYKCFLKGKYKTKNLIVMPSINPVAYGSDVLSEKPHSPFIDFKNRAKSEIYIVGDEIYNFGKVKNLKEL